MANKNKKCLEIIFALALAVATSEDSQAASDGDLGKTSSGSANISLVIPNLVKISKLKDVAFNVYSGDGNLSASSNFVVATNFKGSYRITATGDGPGKSFQLSNGVNKIPYYISFGKTGSSQLAEFVPGVSLSGNKSSSESIKDTRENAKYSILIKDENLKQAEVGEYSGTVTFMVAPD